MNQLININHSKQTKNESEMKTSSKLKFEISINNVVIMLVALLIACCSLISCTIGESAWEEHIPLPQTELPVTLDPWDGQNGTDIVCQTR
jgi:hypothetical protein